MAYSTKTRARRALRYFDKGTAAHMLIVAMAGGRCDERLINLAGPKVREAVDDALRAAARELSGERRVRVLDRADAVVQTDPDQDQP